MNTSPLLIEQGNLSTVWCQTLESCLNNSSHEITPLVVSFTEFDESESVREILDSHLKTSGLASIQTVSETIFPQSLYEFTGENRSELYKQYLKNLPRIKRIDQSNRNGTYFERLVNYGSVNGNINQLEIIIGSLKSKNVKRRSKLQASIFDPTKDHTNRPFQGFPCLQHITFYPSSTGGLIMNSFYAIQYLYRRAYGNWLGLMNLGKFVAAEAGVKLERFNCYVGVEHMDQLSKTQAQQLLKKLSN
jgi:thymidylate synthase